MTIATKPGMQARRIVAATMLAALGLFPSLAMAGPEGTYDMTGTNPDKSSYKGVIEVRRTGETYAVIWRFGSDETHGIGALTTASDGTFGVSYASGRSHGIALYELQSDGTWSGTWSNTGGKTLGTEIWYPRGGATTTTRSGKGGSTPATASTPDGQGAARH